MSRCECAGCFEHFVSVESFDAHRRDATEDELATDKWLTRRCRVADDMTATGWEKTPKGWRSPRGIRKLAKTASRRLSQAA
jgi:hypothetical protein